MEYIRAKDGTDFVAETAACPECDGEGKIETMTNLTYDGDQSWSVKPCGYCNGSGESKELVSCKECGDYIRVEDATQTDNGWYHVECFDAEDEQAIEDEQNYQIAVRL